MEFMENLFRLQRHVAKMAIQDQPSDFLYWQNHPPQIRLAALEHIRREYHQWRYGAEPRLQRVYQILKAEKQ
jgi:hypothetical protein